MDIHQSNQEKLIRKNLEYYFNEYDANKSISSKFGLYYNTFFSKTHDKDFEVARKKAQEKLKEYFKHDCLK